MYAILDTVVQAVLTDENADIDALLDAANAQVQALIDGRLIPRASATGAPALAGAPRRVRTVTMARRWHPRATPRAAIRR